MANRAAKGSAFERWFCKELSLWWTKDQSEPRTDCFWRTAGSGARATMRGKKGQKTAGGYGDVAATDSDGGPLTFLLVLEIKRGYSKATLQDLLDSPKKAAEQTYSAWVKQAKDSCSLAGAFSWAIVCRRDRREPLILIENDFWVELRAAGALNPSPRRLLQLYFELDGVNHTIIVMQLASFFESVHPDHIKKLAKRL